MSLKQMKNLFVMILCAVFVLSVPVATYAGDGDETFERSFDLRVDAGTPEYSTLDELTGKTVGVVQGSIHPNLATENIEDVKLNYYNTQSDMIEALLTNKVDAICVDEVGGRDILKENSNLSYVPECLSIEPFAAIFGKTDSGDKLRGEFDEFIEALKADGTLDELFETWEYNDGEVPQVDEASSLPADNGTVKLAVNAVVPPVMYVADGQITGFEMDIATRFCKEYGYGLEVTDMNFDALIASVTTGKSDMSLACFAITKEREKSVNFSTPYMESRVIVLTRSIDTVSDGSFIRHITDSFRKTFIREGRWKLFVQGVVNTLVIMGIAVIAGTALGFLLYMLCRGGNPVANGITSVFAWLIHGMPVVVLLMILYYIVFGSADISGIAVAVIAFTLIFGLGVFTMLKNAVSTVDKGQFEAAYALGFSDTRTFFKIILPQAMPQFFPVYKGEIVSLIKATAVVGYIAVQDLTKMGDIVRSRTYEAFFPLIAVAVIYFALEWLLAFVVSRVEIKTKRKRMPQK